MGEYAVSFSIQSQPTSLATFNRRPIGNFPFYYTNQTSATCFVALRSNTATHHEFFQGKQADAFASFNPEMKRCLWVCSHKTTNLRLSQRPCVKTQRCPDISLIQQRTRNHPGPEVIYGKQNTQTWCYYFEKADLARQYGQWDEIARLWEESQSIGDGQKRL